MSTLTNFRPVPGGAFTFTPTLDGKVYVATVTWNVYGQRWYLNLFDQNANLVLSLPLIASPRDVDISLTAGYFASTLVFRDTSQQFEVLP